MKKIFIVLLSIIANSAIAQTVYYDYDVAGNRIKRATSQISPKCYTMASPVNGTFLTNFNGVPKLKPENTSNPKSQIWKYEIVGSFYKIISAGGTTSVGVGHVLGVENAGNQDQSPIKLMSYGSGGDHLLWSTAIADHGEVYIRKNSTLNLGVTQGWGTGVPDNTISDLNLGYDPDLYWGGSKWVLTNVGCPNPGAREGFDKAEDSELPNAPITVFPNPSSGSVTVDFNLSGPKDAILSVIRADGSVVFGEKSISRRLPERFNFENLDTGTYLFKLTQGSTVTVKKIVVVK
jgi:hypothetical protein